MPHKQHISQDQPSANPYGDTTTGLQSVLATGYLSLIVIGMVYEALYFFLMDKRAKIHIIPIDSHIQEIQLIHP